MANIANANGAYVSGGSGNVYNLTNQNTCGVLYSSNYGVAITVINYGGGQATLTCSTQGITQGSYFYLPFVGVKNVTVNINGQDWSNYVITRDVSSYLSSNNIGCQIACNMSNYIYNPNIVITFNYQSRIY